MVAATIMLFLMISCSVPTTTENSVFATATPGGSPIIETLLPATITSTDTHISTPRATLSPTQITEIVKALYDNNGGCELPCLWGLAPGTTPIQVVYNRFAEIGRFENYTRPVDVFQVIYFTTTPPNDLVSVFSDGGWGFSMRVKDNMVIGFVTASANIKKFSVPSLSEFFSDFGKPEELRMRIIESMVIGENPDYEIALFYPSRGIFIRWRGETQSVVSQKEKNITVMICPQYMPTQADTIKGLSPPFFYLFSPDKNILFDEIIQKHLSEDPSGSYQPLDKANAKKFYDMYLDPTNKDCIPFSYSFSP